MPKKPKNLCTKITHNVPNSNPTLGTCSNRTQHPDSCGLMCRCLDAPLQSLSHQLIFSKKISSPSFI